MVEIKNRDRKGADEAPPNLSNDHRARRHPKGTSWSK